MKVQIILVLLFAFVAFSKAEENSIESNSAGFSYRLPNTSIPLRYDLWLKTDIEKKSFNFSGNVKIHVKILEITSDIVIHTRDLKIDQINLLNLEKNEIKSNLNFTLITRFSLLVINLTQNVSKDDEMILDIYYHGHLNFLNEGFYRGNYKNELNKTIWYATTHFETTSARKAFPCYDEPGIRAVTSVKIQHHKSYHAISNMAISSRDEVNNTDYVTSIFKDTPPLQPYLIAFVISDFIFVRSNDSRIEQRVYAKPSSINSGGGDHSAKIVGIVLRKLEEYFDMEIPLEKIDHIAVPDFDYGGMENHGAVIYAEYYLLLNVEESYKSKKLSQILSKQVGAHELSHFFFGNLVAPKWWTYTWLNEAFASFYAALISQSIEGEVFWDEKNKIEGKNDFKLYKKRNDTKKAFNFYPQTQSEIEDKFDPFYYEKGEKFVTMFHEALSPETFKKGMKSYVRKMLYSAATPDDLHQELQKAYDEDFPDNELDVGAAMGTWEDQKGFPIVNVRKSGTKFILTQKSSSGGDEIYTIPIFYSTLSDLEADKNSSLIWMMKKTIEIDNENDDEWIIINSSLNGYYLVDYDEDILLNFAETLQRNHTIIPAITRAEIINDFVSYPLKYSPENVSLTNVFKIFNYIKHETEPLPWIFFKGVEKFMSKHIFASPIEKKFNKYMQLLIQPNIDKLGFKVVKNELNYVTYFRDQLLIYSCKAKNETCMKSRFEKLKNLLNSDREFEVRCDGIKAADEETYLKLLEKASKRLYSTQFGCSLDKNLLKIFLESLMKIPGRLSISGLAKEFMERSKEALEFSLDYILENFDEASEK